MSVKARISEPVELCINDGENEIIVHGGIVSGAESKPMSNNSIAAQLKKLGNTVFEAHEISFEIDENIFIPVSELNELRRRAVARLEAERVQKWKRKCKKPSLTSQKRRAEIKPILAVNISTIESFEAAVDGGADVVYVGGEAFGNKEPQMNAKLYESFIKRGVCEAYPNTSQTEVSVYERRFIEREDYVYAIEYGHKKGAGVFIGTPRIVKEIRDYTDLSPDGFLVSNLGVLYHLRGLNKPIVIDYPFNVFNRLTMEHLLNPVFKYGDCCQRVTLSPELTLDEIRNLTPYGATECIVHGFFPLMVSEHDLVGSLFSGGARDALLKDEKGFAFPVKTAQGRTYVMNSRELCMLEYVPEILEAGVTCLRIEAGMYDKNKTREITRAYREAMDKRMGRACEGEYTTGHYFRGVV
jgi:putative protease